MFTKILLCTDGSPQALSATHLVADLACRLDAHIDLVHVLDPLLTAGPSSFAPEAGISDAITLQYAQESQQAILQRTGQVLELAHVPFQSHPELGQPVERIHYVASLQKDDLIVIGSRGLSAWSALLMGSVSDAVARHAPCPVLVVRGEPKGFSKIVIASDGSDGALHAVKAGMELAKEYHSEVSILNVFQAHALYPGVAKGDLIPGRYAAQVKEGIAHQIEPIANETGITYQLNQEQGHPAETLVGFAETQKADLIVVGSRGLGGFQSLLLGSVSTSVLHHARCSVLVVR